MDLKARARLLFERIVNRGELALADSLFAHDFVWPQYNLRGPEGVRAWVTSFRRAFPDVVDTIEAQFADDRSVVTRVTVTGTNHGTFLGLPPTGRTVRFSAVGIDVFRDDKIVERAAYFDAIDLARQLGHDAVPVPQQRPVGLT